jgi:hypothetical protein
MAETPSGGDVERRLERDVDELDERLNRLEDHIDDAQSKAESRRDDADPGHAERDPVPGADVGEFPAGFDDDSQTTEGS